MTTTFVTTATSTTASTDGFDEIFVTSTGSILSTNGTGISVDGSINYIVIDGLVGSGIGNAVRFESDSSRSTVYISETGRVTNLDTGNSVNLVLGDDNSIINDGTVSGGFTFTLEGAGSTLINRGNAASISEIGRAATIRGDDISVLNEGSMTSLGNGISNAGNTINNASIVNSGVISGVEGISFQNGTGLEITNSGTITGTGGTGINSAMVNTMVENSGTIQGDVLLTGNGMVYQGRADGLVIGDVIGGDGEDSFTGASLEDSFFGEGGADDLRGRAGDDIVRGGADDDLVAGNQGDDRVDGNQGDDTLFGNRGDDIVRGGSGDDVISGGRGDDVLTGNSGRDVFVFSRRTDDDIITDFRNNFDQLDLTAYGLENVQALRDAGALVESGAGSIIDLTTIGGDGVIYVDDMSVSDWTGADFIL